MIAHSTDTLYNKKILLRERKRHTTRRVASAPSAVLSHDGGGISPFCSDMRGGVPHPVPMVVLHPVQMGGNPDMEEWGTGDQEGRGYALHPIGKDEVTSLSPDLDGVHRTRWMRTD